MSRSLPFLVLAAVLGAQPAAPPLAGPPVQALRLKVEVPPLAASATSLDAKEVTRDLEGFLAGRGIRVLPEKQARPEGAYDLEVVPVILPFPEGTCLLSVSEGLAPASGQSHAATDADPSWGGNFMAAQAGTDGVVYQARSVVLALADVLLRRAMGKAPAPIQAPSYRADDPPTRRPPAPQPQATDVGFSDIKVRVQPPAPPYPDHALADKIEGTVVVLLTLDPDGRPARAVALSGPPELKATALRYAMQWIFEPVNVGGKPAWVRFKLPMPFRLGR